MRPSLSIVGLVVLGCATPVPQGPTLHAVLIETCAPWDGPAVALFLTERAAGDSYPPPPYSVITVYRGLPQLLGRRFEVGPDTPNLGSGQACSAPGGCVPVSSATIALGGLNPDRTVGVTYRLEVPGRPVLTGRARARLSPIPRRCL